MIRLLCFVLALAVASAPARANKADDTLNVAFQYPLQSLDVYFSPGREALLASFWAWDALLFRDPATLTFKPLLATAWRYVDDKTIELDIRQGVKFHNGDPLTADDVCVHAELRRRCLEPRVRPDRGVLDRSRHEKPARSRCGCMPGA